ncbi:MAG: CBS domain-containing protein [Candidatus Altiarchaeales archaeon]|nr:CBS domain-containing protein [Candidatus Altiarchaeales archaeon]MBD3416636.1 CBS domain-containing protein [Candidatus Altiarchaeales archaeon]
MEGKYWTDNVLTVAGGESLQEAAKMMHDHGISSLMIVEDGRPTGIITERDLVSALAGETDPSKATVSDAMTRDPITIGQDDNINAVKKTMMENNFRHLPVVDDRGNLVGIVSLRDLIKVWVSELSSIVEGLDGGEDI